ncbi:MAG: hypothetical protein SFU56_05280 [Capsulimonadales bacterium]|nr:hypothetical protein [Capsulimonadales bacterium]
MTTAEVIGLLKEMAVVVTAVSGLIASLAALRTGKRAYDAAARAQEAATEAQTRATEAVREQIHFALKRAAVRERSKHEPDTTGKHNDGDV